VVTGKITWGDYGSEHGLLTGIYSGLLLNTVPVVPAALKDRYPVSVDAQGFVLAGGEGGWNTKPAVQYVARGRRPFGPYTFTSGGSVKVTGAKDGPGEGRVRFRIPDGRTTMLTTVNNPTAEPLELELTVNGVVQRARIPAGETMDVSTPVRGGAAPLAIIFRGDRRLVLLETDFR
jgi:hypothetical protein